MKQDWHTEELALHWTLSESELELLGTKTGATRLSFAILLKAFQFDGRFPDRREDIAGISPTRPACRRRPTSRGSGVNGHNATSVR
jgi:hypothetical protein